MLYFIGYHLKFLLKSELALFSCQKQKLKCCNGNMTDKWIIDVSVGYLLTLFRTSNQPHWRDNSQVNIRCTYMKLILHFYAVYFNFCEKAIRHLLTVLSQWAWLFFNNMLQFWSYKLHRRAYTRTGRVNTLVFISIPLFLNILYLKNPKQLRLKHLTTIAIESSKYKLTL